MKRILTITAWWITATVFSASAQPQSNNWMFGDSAWVNFNSGAPQVLQGSSLFSIRSSASISDDAGNLLIYTDGFHVWDKNQQLAVNGDSLWCSLLWYGIAQDSAYYYWNQANQSVLILPDFVSDHYKVLTKSITYPADVYPPNGTQSGLVQNTVWVHGDTTEVVLPKNQFVLKDTAGNIADARVFAVRHANGRDWWVVQKQYYNDAFNVFLLDLYGWHGPYVKHCGLAWGTTEGYGQVTVTEQGERFAYSNANGRVDLYDFDRCSGEISNNVELGSPPYNSNQVLSKSYMSASFSPSGNRLYAATFQRLYQYDLTASNVLASKQNVYTLNPFTVVIGQPDTFSEVISEMHLAPDEKIYVDIGMYSAYPREINYLHSHYLTVINAPDALGTACSVQVNALDLGNARVLWGLPNYPNYALGKIPGSPCDTLNPPLALFGAQQTSVCQNGCVQFQNLSTNPSVAAVSYHWLFPGGTPDASSDSTPPSVCYNAPGSYNVALVATNPFGSDTFAQAGYVVVFAPPSVAVLSQNDSLQATPGYASYAWSWNNNAVGDTTAVIESLGPGLYAVTVTDQHGCTASASYEITAVETRGASDKVRLYPNPSDASFAIALESGTGVVTVTDVLGRIIHRGFAAAPSYVVRTELWPPGLYTVLVKSSHQPVVKKVVVQH